MTIFGIAYIFMNLLSSAGFIIVIFKEDLIETRGLSRCLFLLLCHLCFGCVFMCWYIYNVFKHTLKEYK